MEKLIVYTDGGARGNPGPAAVGIVIQDARGVVIKTHGETIGEATNNEAEYQAVIFALKKIKALFGKEGVKELDVEVRLDSELAGKQLRGEYKIQEERLYPLFIKVWNLRMDFKKVIFNVVSRTKNTQADRLVNQALDREQNALF